MAQSSLVQVGWVPGLVLLFARLQYPVSKKHFWTLLATVHFQCASVTLEFEAGHSVRAEPHIKALDNKSPQYPTTLYQNSSLVEKSLEKSRDMHS